MTATGRSGAPVCGRVRYQSRRDTKVRRGGPVRGGVRYESRRDSKEARMTARLMIAQNARGRPIIGA